MCYACAKVGPLSGPVDETPPQILSHSPNVDQLNVALERLAEIVFSEPMDHRRTEEAIFVSPSIHLDLVARPNATADRVCALSALWRDGGTGARDLRNNALEQSFSLAFATGARLDQGAPRGRVISGRSAARRTWAYDLMILWGRRPEKLAYQTQSGVDGQYEFFGWPRSIWPVGIYRRQ